MKTPVPPTDYRPAKAAALRFSLLAAMAATLTPKNASAEAQPVPGEAAGCPAEARERLIRGRIPAEPVSSRTSAGDSAATPDREAKTGLRLRGEPPADPVPVRAEDEDPADFENTPRAIFIEPRAVSDVIPAASEATTTNRVVIGGTPYEPQELEAGLRNGWFFLTPRAQFIEPETLLALSPEEQKRLVDAYNEYMKRRPTSVPYTVKEGETLSEIALRSKTTVAALACENGIKDPDRLQAGQKILIPEPFTPVSSILDVFPVWMRRTPVHTRGEPPMEPRAKNENAPVLIEGLFPADPSSEPEEPVPAPTMGEPPMEPVAEPEEPVRTPGKPPMDPAAEPEQTEPPRVMGVPPMEPAAEPSREP